MRIRSPPPPNVGTAWPGRTSSGESLTTVSTAGCPDEVVRISHPFHPLNGQKIDVVAHRAQWGETRVYYRDRLGHRASLPTCWTSLAAEDPYITAGAGRSHFRVPDLIDLVALLEDLRP